MAQGADWLLYIHPAMQLAGIIFGYMTLYWGVKRHLTVHHGMRLSFAWKRHVLCGKVALLLWLAGIVAGLYFTRARWGFLNITGWHYAVGMTAIPFILVTFCTGYWMDLFKKKRKYMGTVHGITGMLLGLLVFVQIITGVQVFLLLVWH